MREASIPVDLYNPGEVLACLGMMEVAETIRGNAVGWFEATDGRAARFRMQAAGSGNPIAAVLEFLSTAEAKAVSPTGWAPKKEAKNEKARQKQDEELRRQERWATFPGKWPDGDRELPVALIGRDMTRLVLSHWTPGPTWEPFKLYAGNRSALSITLNLLRGRRKSPKGNQAQVDMTRKGVLQLWDERRDELTERPFDAVTPIGGSFNLDARSAWTALDAGYSPNNQKHGVEASPVVEMLAACGLQNSRPDRDGKDQRRYRYTAWNVALPVELGRPAFSGRLPVPGRRFTFRLQASGSNSTVNFAEEEAD